MNCANHPERERVAFCQNCGKPLCQECTRTVGTAVFCEPCLAAKHRRCRHGPSAGSYRLTRLPRAVHAADAVRRLRPASRTPASPLCSASSPASEPCTTASTPRESFTSSSSPSSSRSPTNTASSASSSPAGCSIRSSRPTRPPVPAATAPPFPTPSASTISASASASANPGPPQEAQFLRQRETVPPPATPYGAPAAAYAPPAAQAGAPRGRPTPLLPPRKPHGTTRPPRTRT